MNYYYHPILGLQYTNIGSYYVIDIAKLPEFDKDLWTKYIYEYGTQFI